MKLTQLAVSRTAASRATGPLGAATTLLLAAAMAFAGDAAHADEQAIRASLATLAPKITPIEEVRRLAPSDLGLWEVRFADHEIIYTNARGTLLFEGKVIDLVARKDLTAARQDALSHLSYAKLDKRNAIVTYRHGTGEREIAIFADPNCGYCKLFESSLQQSLRNATVYTYVIPILGADSIAKSTSVLCAPDAAVAWNDWMLRKVPPPKTETPCARATSGIEANLALARKHRIRSTPTIVLSSDERLVGAVPIESLEKSLPASNPSR